jgi:hypothetical protein
MNASDWMPVIFLISVVACIGIGVIKGRILLGILLGLLTGPLGLIAILCFPSAVKACPSCKKNVPKDAVKCAFCQTELAASK